ncbi:SDR family NAD(P)-dependent oxidoreductase [Dyadobacter sp. MSC1_007]|jgi:NAD(P)-dependent dehydrogenase (short-subunit alcohol dehydrogenase family)|uniref:SDR family NAD(P)-dependent oxidoreductase n=1 Tax=Dyadobacter sp. MSC1_007 TaxID=2909264 RepID=UPI00202FDF55|nr:SDR family oxidoreductase [Dyadobacter sp. MSC1_007]
MENWLANKSIVIIGGTTGVGFSAAKAFVRNGANVVVVGHSPESCLIAELNLGGTARAKQGDAYHPQTTLDAIQLCIREFGSFDGLYHVSEDTSEKQPNIALHDLTLESWNDTLDLSLTSMMLSNQAAVRAFLGMNKGGTILNLNAAFTSPSSPNHAHAAAGAAIIGFSKSIAASYASKNIRINVISAGSSPDQGEYMEQLPGSVAPGELDGTAVYLMSDYAKFTTGQVLTIDHARVLVDGQF